MIAIQADDEGLRVYRGAFPRLLYVCDFASGDGWGGDILMDRLLNCFDRDHLASISRRRSDVHNDLSKNPPLKMTRTFYLRQFQFGGRAHNIAGVLNLLVVPWYALRVALIAIHTRAEVLLTVAHGWFFLATVIAARLCRLPAAVIVHDDWVYITHASTRIPLRMCHWLFAAALRAVACVYSVSEGMRERLRDRYSVDSLLQLPGGSSWNTEPGMSEKQQHEIGSPLRIVFAGNITAGVSDSIDLVIAAVCSPLCQEILERRCTLELYTRLSHGEAEKLKWARDGVVLGGWLSQEALRERLLEADVLLLPVAFSSALREIVTTSFPSKLVDYLVAARPVLVCGPSYSSAVRHVRKYQCGEIVDDPHPTLVLRALRRIIYERGRQQWLIANGKSVFETHHQIAKQQKEFLQHLCEI